jgi:NAD(P)-dependent dehydrogenase (short-subunit alcohol dehydrogenase family)
MTREKWTAEQMPDQTGRTVLVTGANSGLGFASARALAAHGAHVVLAVRDEAKGRRAVDAVRAQQPDASLEVRQVDLADLDSVRTLAAKIIDDDVRIDVLMNNAGIMMPPRGLSPQGHELQFASNHLGHFALTGLLLPQLRADDPRVVVLSSSLHRPGRIHFDDLTGAKSYSPTGFYAQSKFANTVFALELDRRLRTARSPVRSVLAHPGYAATNLQTSGPGALVQALLRFGNVVMAQSADAGARPQLFAATDPRVRSGDFYGPDGLAENRGYPKKVQPVGRAADPETGRRLWELSEELTGVRYNLSDRPL